LTVPSDEPIAAEVSATDGSAKKPQDDDLTLPGRQPAQSADNRSSIEHSFEGIRDWAPPVIELAEWSFADPPTEMPPTIMQQIDEHAVGIGMR
jgi:hypothetical protein